MLYLGRAILVPLTSSRIWSPILVSFSSTDCKSSDPPFSVLYWLAVLKHLFFRLTCLLTKSTVLAFVEENPFRQVFPEMGMPCSIICFEVFSFWSGNLLELSLISWYGVCTFCYQENTGIFNVALSWTIECVRSYWYHTSVRILQTVSLFFVRCQLSYPLRCLDPHLNCTVLRYDSVVRDDTLLQQFGVNFNWLTVWQNQHSP